MTVSSTLVWFRLDLRLDDQPALHAAVARGGPVVPVYIWDPDAEGEWAPGAANRWWTHQALQRLESQLRDAGSRLVVRQGESLTVLRELIAETGASAVFWNRCYQPAIIARDAGIKATLRDSGLEVHSFNGGLLFEPWTIRTRTGTPYRVFTPFSRACLAAPSPGSAIAPVERIPELSIWPESVALEDLELEPTIRWDAGLKATWDSQITRSNPVENGVHPEMLAGYRTDRDRPALPATSRLSPFLQIGAVSVRRLWSEVNGMVHGHPDPAVRLGGEGFQRQLLWREFAYHLLYHAPETVNAPLRPEFARFPWVRDADALCAWQQGRTGFPLVDAGMRQLWRTGWMHNRVRMLVGSFLVKDLRINWQEGARWFWQTLIDADLANNTMGWQWIAGCGADASPYFRIFNPTTQGERFDPDGAYVRQWVPELVGLPSTWIHRPSEAPEEVLANAGVRLGISYPLPMVDHAVAREAALAALATIKR